jgi:hypothetical protein
MNISIHLGLVFLQIFIILFFWTIHMLLYRSEIGHYNGVNPDNWVFDLFYFTTTSHSTVGYGDITPVKVPSRLTCCFHQLTLITMALFTVSSFLSLDFKF